MKSDNSLNNSLPTALLLGEFAVDFDISPAVALKDDAVLNSSNTINNNTTKDTLNHSRNLSKTFNETVAGNVSGEFGVIEISRYFY